MIVYILVLTQPYLQWFGVGTDSDVQIYPFLAALPAILLAQARIRQVDSVFVGAVVTLLLLAVLHIIIFGLDAYLFFRGLYGYTSLILLTLAFVSIFRLAEAKQVEIAIKVAFWLWALGGILQLIDPDWLTFWRDKLISTPGRGSLSFATEPAYFALALLLLAVTLTIMRSGNAKYLYLAAFFCLIVAQSSVGVVYAGVALLLFASARKTRYFTLAVTLAVGALVILLVLDRARIGTVLVDFLASPLGLAADDMSYGLRLTNLILPAQAFFEAAGLPHGLYAWPEYQYHAFLRTFSEYSWTIPPPAGESSGRILSVHGRLLFELGVFSVLVYYFIWNLLRRSSIGWRVFALCMTMFLNGLTLNSPFLSIVLAAAYVWGGDVRRVRLATNPSSQRA